MMQASSHCLLRCRSTVKSEVKTAVLIGIQMSGNLTSSRFWCLIRTRNRCSHSSKAGLIQNI